MNEQIVTPALCLDLDRMDRNIHSLVQTCKEHGVDWRPHIKCHKSPWIAQRLMDAGAVGLTCATLREAEVMAAAGIEYLLIANMVAGRAKLERTARLARVANVLVCADSEVQVRELSKQLQRHSASLGALIEIEIGFHRVGVAPGLEAVRLAKQIADLPGLTVAGVMAYEGHLLSIQDQKRKADEIRTALALAVDSKRQIEQAGIACPIVSCGGTGSYLTTVSVPGVSEIQAGGAIFMDAFYRDACQVPHLEQALTIVSTVVSRPAPQRAVIDAGRKTMDISIHCPQVLDRPGVEVDWLAAEHGVLKLASIADPIAVGDQVRLVPGYGDLTTVLHRKIYGMRQGRVDVEIPVVH